MKWFSVLSIIIASLSILGCEPAATFDKPQPDNVNSLSTFPKRLQGHYLDSNLISVLTITDKLITRHYDVDFKEHKDSLGLSYQLSGDTLINLTDGTREKISLKGDTVLEHETWTDTLFNISADNVVKKFKGYYFLNNRYKGSSWEVKELLLHKGMLTVGSISNKADIQKLKEITESTEDTISTHFSLTKNQFKHFIRQDGFLEQEKFVRMKE